MRHKRRSTPAAPIDPPRWRVAWRDFTEIHDWVGAGRRLNGKRKSKRKEPVLQSLGFLAEADARRFVKALIRKHGRENVAVKVASLRELLVPGPTQQRLPGDWRHQRRSDRKVTPHITTKDL